MKLFCRAIAIVVGVICRSVVAGGFVVIDLSGI